MNIQQGLNSLLSEIETILKTDLPPQRQQYFAGASHYLHALQQMAEENVDGKKPARMKKSSIVNQQKHEPSSTDRELHAPERSKL